MSEGILTRSADLLVLGLRWTGMQPVATALEAPLLQATSDAAKLMVTFPPQHVGEETADWPWWGPIWTSLGGEAVSGGHVAAMSTNGRLDVFFAADDGIAYVVTRQAGETAWGAPRPTTGATFVPGTKLVAVGSETVLVFAVDDAGRLCELVVDGSSLSGWFPVNAGEGENGGFEPSSEIGVTFTQGETSVFLVRHERLIHWRASTGMVDVRQLPIAARIAAESFSEFQALVVWVSDFGEVVVERWDGTSWFTDNFSTIQAGPGEAPIVQLTPQSIVHARTESSRLMLFFVTGDGVLRAMTTSLSFDAWRDLKWHRIDQNFPAVTPIATQLLVSAAGVFKRPLLGVGHDGKMWATWCPNRGDGVGIEAWMAIGDWFPPGTYPCLIPHGSDGIEAFAVANDRTVRHASMSGGVWHGVPPTWEAIGDIRRRRGRLAGPSQVAIAFAAGETLSLTATGVLSALASRPLLPWPDEAPPGPGDGTLLELPWGLFVSPATASGAEVEHRLDPVVSKRGTVGLWHSQLGRGEARGRAARASELRAVGIRGDEEGGEGFVPALREGVRAQIHQATRDEGPFLARGTMLSALGAWLDAEGDWSALEWEHRAIAGRDLTVRTVERGALYPFGHAVTYEEQITRRFDPRSLGSVAVLHRQGTLHVSEPVHDLPADAGEQFRSFPFTQVELGATTIKDLDPPRRQAVLADGSAGELFLVERAGAPLAFPVWLRRDGSEVLATVPLVFVPQAALEASDQAAVQARLAAVYAQADRADLRGAAVRLAGEQIFETHALQLTGGAPATDSVASPFVAKIVGATVGLPAVRQLTQKADAYAVTLNQAYRQAGDTRVLLETTAREIGVDFAGRADLAGGLATPSFAANAISGAGEPIRKALAGAAAFDPQTLFDPNAKLLGIVPLKDVIAAVVGGQPPSLSSVMSTPPVVRFSWMDQQCQGAGPFRPIEGATSTLSLEVTATGGTSLPPEPPHITTHGSLTSFCLDLAGVLVVDFGEVVFDVETGHKPALKLRGLDFHLAGKLKFLEVLQEAASALVGELPVAIAATPKGITASHHIAVPPISFPVGTVNVSIQDLVFSTALRLPFDDQVGVDLSFASRKHPFLLGIWVLGGGGYLTLTIEGDRITEFACAAEIGGLWSFDWALVAGEVHALVGIDIRLNDAGLTLTGYLRVGGTVDVLGLVSVGIELSAQIQATDPPLKVFARASLVLDVDLFLVSTSVSLEKTVQIYGEGGILEDAFEARRRVPTADAARDAWIAYRRAFEGAA